MTTVLFDHPLIRTNLMPFTYTRPVSEIRVGIFKITEKWQKYLDSDVNWLTADYLRPRFSSAAIDKKMVYINGALCPDKKLVAAIDQMNDGEVLVGEHDIPLAFRTGSELKVEDIAAANGFKPVDYRHNYTLIYNCWDIFLTNRSQIKMDFDLLDERNRTEITDPHTKLYNEKDIWVDKGAKVHSAILNAEHGPIYIGKDAEIQEGSIVRGAFALCEHAVISMGAKMRGDTTIGPWCKAGGEIGNSVMFGYSNKAHDGYMGNSVIGEWCNLGADSNTSNLKNNYQSVRLWHYGSEQFIDTGQQFCGLMMADHVKCGINTMFNTGTVVGVGANLFGEGFMRNFIPSFAWGGSARGLSTFRLDKFFEMTETVMKRRNKHLSEQEKEIFIHVFNASSKFRTWEKS